MAADEFHKDFRALLFFSGNETGRNQLGNEPRDNRIESDAVGESQLKLSSPPTDNHFFFNRMKRARLDSV